MMSTGAGESGPGAVSLCWGTIMRASLPELFAAAGAAGFDAVSVPPPIYADARASGFSDSDLRRRRDDAGISVSLIDPLMSALPGSPDPLTVGGRFAPSFSYGEEDCYRIAAALDAPTINVAHYMGADVPVASLVDSLGAICGRAAMEGLGVLLEFMPEGSVPDLATALSIVRAIGAPNLAVLFDTWHFFRTGGTPDDLAGLAEGEIGGVQASDAPASQRGVIEAGVNTRLLPGVGAIPLHSLIERILSLDADAFMGIEVFSTELNELSLDEAAQRARESMRGVVA
jgi:sugar phosphate isomerase/epimerase